MSTLKVNSIIPVAGVPTGGGGGIIQITQTTKKDVASLSLASNTTSSAFESVTGCTLSITPTNSSSKILVDFMINTTVGVNGATLMYTLSRKIGSGSFSEVTDYLGDSAGSRHRCSIALVPEHNEYSINQARLSFLDSPSTTSVVTYGFRVRHDSGTTRNVYINRSDNDSDVVYVARPCTVLKLSEVSA
tara:strand:+ start:13 stop:579 length:567 start_codon:yes stop_codon:yes gene_type:complete